MILKKQICYTVVQDHDSYNSLLFTQICLPRTNKLGFCFRFRLEHRFNADCEVLWVYYKSSYAFKSYN